MKVALRDSSFEEMVTMKAQPRWIARLVVALCLIPIPVTSQETLEVPLVADLPNVASNVGLDQLITLAQENSPKLRAAAEAIEMARGEAIQAGLWPNPTASSGSPQMAGSESQYFNFLSQEIVTAGKLRLSRSAAVQDVVKAELAFIRARFDLLTQVRQQFFVVLAGQRRVEILRTLVEIAQKSRDTSVRLEKAGEGSRTDVLLLEIELQRARLGLENAETILQADRRQLAAFIGLPNLVIDSVSGDLVAPVVEYNEEELRKNMLEVNALAISAQVEVHRSRILLRRARVEPIPNPRLMGGFQYSVTPLNNQAIFQIDVPIPVFNRNQGNIRSARAAISKSMAELGNVENELLALLADSLGRFRAATQQVTTYEKDILPSARDAQAITQKGYVQGQFDFLRLLQAQRTLVEADLGYVNSQADRWTTAAEIAGLLQQESFPPPATR
ncbi:MAG: TolC family protein [Planctomycetota bacterium]